jgi:hypothetical protein
MIVWDYIKDLVVYLLPYSRNVPYPRTDDCVGNCIWCNIVFFFHDFVGYRIPYLNIWWGNLLLIHDCVGYRIPYLQDLSGGFIPRPWLGYRVPYKIDLVTYLFLKRIARRKTKVGHEWYQSTALSLLSRRWFFLFVFKGTVSPDIGFCLKVYKIESVLFVGPLMVFAFFFIFVDHEIFTIIF